MVMEGNEKVKDTDSNGSLHAQFVNVLQHELPSRPIHCGDGPPQQRFWVFFIHLFFELRVHF